MTIALTAFKEKIRKKELYIVSVIGVVILLIFGTGTGTLTINGVAVTGYKMLASVLLTVVNALCCILAVIMSLGTIPNEYERNTSHLVWIRNVPQSQYHCELAFANILSGLAAEAVLFAAMVIFVLVNDRAVDIWRLIPAYLIVGLNVAVISLLTSVLSIIIEKFAAGTILAAVTFIGIFHSLLYTFKDIIGGLGGNMIKYALKVIPNLHGIQTQAGNTLCGRNIDIHIILTGMLAVYVFVVLILILKKKEV